MSKKRIEAREWKRKKSQKKMVGRSVIAGLCLLIVAGIGFMVWDNWNRGFIMVFEGERIPTSDLSWFFAGGMWGRPADSAAEELANFLLIERAAERHNVALTAEEREELLEDAQGTMEFLDMQGVPMQGVTLERMVDFMGEQLLTERLMDIYAPDVEVDETEFLNDFLSFTITNRHEFVQMNFMLLESHSFEEATLAQDELQAASSLEEMEQIIIQNMLFGAGGGIDLGDLGDFGDIDIGFDMDADRVALSDLQWAVDQMTMMSLSNMMEGQVSEPIEIDGGYYVFVAEFVNEPPMDEVQERFRSNYIRNMQFERFSEIVDSWRESANIQINQRAVNAA